MGIDDREYMKERYRRRGGAVGIPIWRDRHARMEYDEADMVAGRYRAQAGCAVWGTQSPGSNNHRSGPEVDPKWTH